MENIIDSQPEVTRKDRTVEYRWPIGPGESSTYDGQGIVYAVLFVSHDGDRKQYFASTHPATIYPNGVLSMSISLLAQGFRHTEPTARYSAKALEAFAAKALAALRAAHASGDTKVVGLFTVDTVTATS